MSWRTWQGGWGGGPVGPSGGRGQGRSFLGRFWDTRGSAPNNPEQGFGVGPGRGARFQIWEETQPQGPGGHCQLKGPGPGRRCPGGWASPSFPLVPPAASELSIILPPSTWDGLDPPGPEQASTLLPSWGGVAFTCPTGAGVSHCERGQERELSRPSLRSQLQDPTGLGAGAGTLPLAPDTAPDPHSWGLHLLLRETRQYQPLPRRPVVTRGGVMQPQRDPHPHHGLLM